MALCCWPPVGKFLPSPVGKRQRVRASLLGRLHAAPTWDTQVSSGETSGCSPVLPVKHTAFSAADATLGHGFRGVSVHHLNTQLMQQVQDVGLTSDASIYQVEPAVISPASENVICPRDGRRGAAYVDTLRGEDHAGMSHLMLSYTWAYSIGDIAGALFDYSEERGLDASRTYIWICCLCINQHRVREQQRLGQDIPFCDFARAFGWHVEGIGHVLALIAPWEHPQYLRRAWCVFEMYTAINREGVDVTIVTAPREQKTLKAALTSVEGIEGVFRVFSGVNIQNAEAAVQSDKRRILQMVEDGPGFEELNGQISRYLQNWVLQSSMHQLELCRGDGDHELTALLCTKIGTLMGYFGLAENEASLLQEAQLLREQHGTMSSLDGVELLRKIAQRQILYEDFPAAEESLGKAQSICLTSDLMQSSCGVNLLATRGRLQHERGDFRGALVHYAQAQRLSASLGVIHYKDEASLLKNRGEALLEQGRVLEAASCLRRVAALYDATGLQRGPASASLLRVQALLQRSRGHRTRALEMATEALSIRRQVGALRAKSGALLLQALGDIRSELGDSSGGACAYKEAMAVYEAMHLPHDSRRLRDLSERLLGART